MNCKFCGKDVEGWPVEDVIEHTNDCKMEYIKLNTAFGYMYMIAVGGIVWGG